MSESVALAGGWINWREAAGDDEDPDDEELAKTPPDVVRALGFDPLDDTEDSAAKLDAALGAWLEKDLRRR